MRLLFWLVLYVALVTVQTTIVPLIKILGVAPDILLLAVILLSIYRGSDEVLLFALVLGYTKDLYSGGVMGVSLLVFFLVAYFIAREKNLLDFDNYLLVFLMVFGAITFEGLLALYLQSLIVSWSIEWWTALSLIIGKALYSYLAIVFISAALQVLQGRYMNRLFGGRWPKMIQ